MATVAEHMRSDDKWPAQKEEKLVNKQNRVSPYQTTVLNVFHIQQQN